jgi:hypothetical protein
MGDAEGADEAPCVDLVALHEDSRRRQGSCCWGLVSSCSASRRLLAYGSGLLTLSASCYCAASVALAAPSSVQSFAVPGASIGHAMSSWPLAIALVAGMLLSAAIAVLLVVVFRGRALQWATGVLLPSDLLPQVASERRFTALSGGSIALVGAGSGSVSQLTLEAFAALQAADVVICDRLLPAQLHAAVPRSAVLHVADKIPGKADVAQNELNAWGIAALRQGRNVVRLKVCGCA